MSLDTSKRKIKAIWEETQNNSNQIDRVTLIQGKKNTQVKLSSPNSVQFSKFQTMNSEWLPIETKEVEVWMDLIRGIAFQVEVVVPENWVPYAKLNLAYRRTGNIEVFDNSIISLTQFVQIINIQNSNLKKLIYNIGFIQEPWNGYPFYDYEMKLFFTMINPLYCSAS